MADNKHALDWSDMVNDRDASGNLTPLAQALDVIGGTGCDCGVDEPGSCIGCVCEAALKWQWKRTAGLSGIVESVRSIAGEPGVFLDVSVAKLAEDAKRPMTESARLKAKEAIRKLRERFADIEKAWGDACADTLGEGMDKVKDAHAIISELCSAIETRHLHETNEYIENARKRARDFLEANDRGCSLEEYQVAP
jgi:hypothetical protein